VPILSLAEGKALLQQVTCGADQAQLAELMAGWDAGKKAQGWELIAEYFRSCADFNPELETGKAIARLNLLFKNSISIQDFKACLAIQKELNKLLSLYAE
jgi:hypothetical protein